MRLKHSRTAEMDGRSGYKMATKTGTATPEGGNRSD